MNHFYNNPSFANGNPIPAQRIVKMWKSGEPCQRCFRTRRNLQNSFFHNQLAMCGEAHIVAKKSKNFFPLVRQNIFFFRQRCPAAFENPRPPVYVGAKNKSIVPNRFSTANSKKTLVNQTDFQHVFISWTVRRTSLSVSVEKIRKFSELNSTAKPPLKTRFGFVQTNYFVETPEIVDIWRRIW